jgi:hypothetical protein
MAMQSRVFTFVCGGLLVLGAGAPLTVLAQARLESPSDGGNASGIGLIRGWRCEEPANGLIQLVIDGSIMVDAPYGSARGDTQEACGDKDNGWGTTFNFNTIGEGEHTITASADGEQFDSATFNVGKPSDENYLRGAPLTYYILPDFPGRDDATVIQWQESDQNFIIVETPSGVVPEGGTWKNSEGNDFDVCWEVSDDGKRITSDDSDCDDGRSLVISGKGTTAGGLGCQLGLATSADIPIQGGLFVYTFVDPVGVDSIGTIVGRFTNETNARGVTVITSVTINECTVEYTNKH